MQEVKSFNLVDSTLISELEVGNLFMMAIGCVLIYLAIKKKYEPLLLIPIGFGMIVGNIPSIYADFRDPHSVFHYLYYGINKEIYPPLIFLGIGAMTDFSPMIANPKLILLGAAAQLGVFLTFTSCLLIGKLGLGIEFTPQEAGAIGIIGGADGPTSIFLANKLAPTLLGPIAIAAYTYMAMVPIIQPPIIRLLTSAEERKIPMKPLRKVSKTEKMIFPIIGFLVCTIISPDAVALLGMIFFGNLLKEAGVTERLAQTARTSFIDIVTILLAFCVGAGTRIEQFPEVADKLQVMGIFMMGIVAFAFSTAGGVIMAKLMNLISKEKINPMVGASGVSAVPMSSRVVQSMAAKANPSNFLLMHAMAPNVSGVLGTAMAAGILLSILG